MKVSIIGGGGLVGSCAAYALQCGGIVSGIDLIDLNADLCRGQALDLLHGSSLAADQKIRSGSYELIPESDLVCITAGLRRKPDESRLDLINRNVELFLGILSQVKAAGLKKDAIVLVVSNPVDVLTYLATAQLGLPSSQVLSLGTQLDSARFRGLIAQELNLPPTQVTATILGEHGDSMVPIWSAAQAAGLPLEKFPGWTASTAETLFAKTRGSGAEVIKLKGGAGFAVGPLDRRGHPRRRARFEADLARRIARERHLRHPRRLPVGADGRRSQGGRGAARNRPLAEGSLGLAALGAGPPRDDRPRPEEEPRAAKSSPKSSPPKPRRRTAATSRSRWARAGMPSSSGSSRVTISGQSNGGRRG